MATKILKVHPADNIIIALSQLEKGEKIAWNGREATLPESIPAKHKFAQEEIPEGAPVIMYGVEVGRAARFIAKGARITTVNTRHSAGRYEAKADGREWARPDVSRFRNRTFMGYHRADGRVGTMNYWLVAPLVFCENRNIGIIRSSMLEQLGYTFEKDYAVDIQQLVRLYRSGAGREELLAENIIRKPSDMKAFQIFPNIDGIKFLTHEGGCGGTRQDSETLCRLLAGYIAHPNVAGATILSLGCQNAQFKLLEKAIAEFAPGFSKPLIVMEQQKSRSERAFIAETVKQTFVGLMDANEAERSPAPLRHLSLGLECGGSDGFSGISANPALGYASDLLVALGGTAILSEFPELNGVEQELAGRCVNDRLARKFSNLMETYSKRAKQAGSGFEMNPSPGNIRDGLITDAMKSAGAAKKGGTSPVVDVLDYTEQAVNPGLNLLCTPGNDVESTTGLAGSGATLIAFTTGLGTPTGNPIAPTVKISSNTALAERMPDIIDFNAGTIIDGEDTIESKGEELLELLIQVASGKKMPRAVSLGQDDFIPWKRGVSL